MWERMSLVLVASVFFISSIFANCPDLTGEWTCTNEEGQVRSEKMVYSIENGVPVYKTSSEDGEEYIYADGIERQYEGDGQVVTFSFRCEGGQLLGNFKSEQYYGNSTVSLENSNHYSNTIYLTMPEYGYEATVTENCRK